MADVQDKRRQVLSASTHDIRINEKTECPINVLEVARVDVPLEYNGFSTPKCRLLSCWKSNASMFRLSIMVVQLLNVVSYRHTR